MMIYPTMELQNGLCVTLDKGRLDEPMLWHVLNLCRRIGIPKVWLHQI